MSRSNSQESKRSGTERAAILLLSLGEAEATEVMKHMGAKDVQRIGAAMTQLANISRAEVTDVLNEFTSKLESQTSLGVGVDDYLRKVLIGALGEDKAGGVIDRILFGRSSKGLEALKWMDSRAVAELIRQEHPQIISIVLAYLDADQSAEILAVFPEWLRADVIMRIATLDGIQPSALHELDEVIEKQFAGKTGALKTSIIGGVKTAAQIMNFMDSSQESTLIDNIRKVDDALGGKIQDLMFVFGDLVEIDDRGMQEVLRAVPGEKLLIAMKGADDELKSKIFKNMSQRAAEMLKDDLESRGPVRLSEVEGAQKEILATVRKMSEAGTIQLGGKGEEFVWPRRRATNCPASTAWPCRDAGPARLLASSKKSSVARTKRHLRRVAPTAWPRPKEKCVRSCNSCRLASSASMPSWPRWLSRCSSSMPRSKISCCNWL